MLLSHWFWMFRMMQNEVALLGEILTHVGHHAAPSAQSPNCQVSCRIHEALARSGHPAFEVVYLNHPIMCRLSWRMC